ncbi:MAG: DUF3267 domain-containing protein [Bacteroidales bacterium]|nr:DUF3267 domain-containing protein [Bacteroidales bacterium]
MAVHHDQHQYEISLPLEKVYRIAMILLPVVFLLYLLPYLVFWYKPFAAKLVSFTQAVFSRGGFMVLRPYLIKGTISIVAGIVLHELLHGLGWLFFTRNKFRSLSFGFMIPELAPYAHCKEPLPLYGYRIGILLPGIILGLLPAMYGIVTGSFTWLCYGMLFTWAASGDLIMFWQIRNLGSETMVMDHPEKLGCIVLE